MAQASACGAAETTRLVFESVTGLNLSSGSEGERCRNSLHGSGVKGQELEDWGASRLCVVPAWLACSVPRQLLSINRPRQSTCLPPLSRPPRRLLRLRDQRRLCSGGCCGPGGGQHGIRGVCRVQRGG